MKRKSVYIFGFVGAFALSIGFIKDLQTTKVFAQNEQSKIVAIEKEELGQKMIDRTLNREGNLSVTVTAEEQEPVENSSILSGFVPQENGLGFFFKKER